ncbi:MAG TPA: CsgG/HfaB family protein [Geminicoccaceae bacterium]|nr:CsgG/HfaB family protein [Geminicoccaceae bacterium]
MARTGFLAAAAAATLLTGCLGTSSTETGAGGSLVTGSGGMSAAPQAAATQLARCNAPLGTVALVEEQIPGLAQVGLTSPIPVLRLMITQSGCFNVVDRGQALTRIQEEQALTGRGGSKRDLVAAQYFLTPNIVFKDQNAGGGGGALGAFGSVLPGYLGLIGSAVGYKASEAQSVLFLTQTNTGIQIAAAEGSAQTKDWTFAGFGGGSGVFGGLGAYGSTDIGKTVTAALLDAYSKLVAQVMASQG